MHRLWVFTLPALFSACVDSTTKNCADIVCPAGTQCVAELEACYDNEDIAACEGLGEGAACLGDGRCESSVCVPAGCGDGRISGAEQCDGDDLSTASCESAGFYEGSASCGITCKIDTSACIGFCGDGEITHAEECEAGVAPTDSQDCVSNGFDGGDMACSDICSLQPSGCMNFGFVREEAFAAATLNSVWGASQNAVFAVGDAGTIRFYDGSSWQGMGSPVLGDLVQVRGTSESDVWAISDSGDVIHYDGVSWRIAYKGPQGTSFAALHVAASDSVFATGTKRGEGYSMHFNGTNWFRLPEPNELRTNTGIWGISRDDFFLVGIQNVTCPAGLSCPTNYLVQRYQGDSWEIVHDPGFLPQIGELRGDSPDNLYFVVNGFIHHYDGTEVVTIQSPVCTSIARASQDELLAICDDGIARFQGGALIDYHSGRFNEVTALEDGTLVAIDADSAYRLPPGAPERSAVPNVEMQKAWAPGPRSIFYTDDELRFVRTDRITSNRYIGTNDFVDLWGHSATFACAVSSDELVCWDGTGFVPEASPVDSSQLVDGSGPTNFYVANSEQIAHYNGEWNVVGAPLGANITAISATDQGVWALDTLASTLYYYDGTQFSVPINTGDRSISDILAIGEDLWVTTLNGVFRRQGDQLVRESQLPDAPFRAIHGTSTHLFAQSGGVTYFFNGTTWTRRQSPVDSNSVQIAVAEDYTLFYAPQNNIFPRNALTAVP